MKKYFHETYGICEIVSVLSRYEDDDDKDVVIKYGKETKNFKFTVVKFSELKEK